MNLVSIEADLYERLGYPPSPSTAVQARLRRFINETQREIVGMRGLSRLRRTVLQFSVLAGDPFAVLPQAVANVVAVVDRDNQWPMTEMSILEARARDPGLNSTSNPDGYVIINLSSALAVEIDPAGEDISVISSSASDGATKKVFIEGVVAGGNPFTYSVALNGTTAVNLSSAPDWTHITKFYISLTAGGLTTAAGNIVLHKGTTGLGDELSRISVGRTYARYTRLMLSPTPSVDATLYADVELHITDMAQAGDEPIIPEDFHWLISCGALKKEYSKRQQHISYGEESSRWKKGIEDLKAFVVRSTGVGSRNTSRQRFSQLGPNFSAGS